MTDARTNRRVATLLGVITVVQLVGTWIAVAEIHEFLAGLGAELPIVVRAGLELFRYPVLAIAAIPVFVLLAMKAPSRTFATFVAAWLLSVVGGAAVCWALWLVNHVLAGNVR